MFYLFLGIRHFCEEGDKLQKYGWIEHDGRNYGRQEIIDANNNVRIVTSFVKSNHSHENGGEWSVRIEAEQIDKVIRF